MPETAISVAGLTNYIQELLEQDQQLRKVWVVGEVSSLSQHRSGIFFTLQDPDAKASIRCVVWNSQKSKLVQLPTTGEQLIVLGSIRLYPSRGQYQLTVWQALPGGEGLQALRYIQLRNRLASEGLFDKERKQPLPTHPQIVAVVTSPQAAAWGDIQRTFWQRYPGLRILLSPAQVQGESAPASIVKAIERVERDGRAQLLLLARGGGAREDLACFNDERVVRAIANCSIPLLTGIGHQRDESLADLAADLSTHTPTAAAEMAVPELVKLDAEHQQRKLLLTQRVTEILNTSEQQLQRLQQRLQKLPIERQLQQERQSLNWQRQRLLQLTSARLSQGRGHCQLLRQKLVTLDPHNVLKRGYGVVRKKDGSIARTTADLILGEELNIQLGQGQVKVIVMQTFS